MTYIYEYKIIEYISIFRIILGNFHLTQKNSN